MSDRATTAWTEFRPRFTMAVIAVFGAGVLVGVETGVGRIMLAVVILAAMGASLARDGYLGVVIGLVGAAGLIVLKRLSGDFAAREFFVIGAEVLTVIVAAWVVGILGEHLRTSLDHVARPVVGTISPASSALGVLSTDVGMFRLEEELGRFHRTGEPLSLALVESSPLAYASDVDEDPAVAAARRAVARNVESVTAQLDVVFVLDERTLAVIMPSTDAVAGMEALGRIALAASAATFSGPLDRSRQFVADHLALRTAFVSASGADGRADGLVDEALELLSGGTAQGQLSA
ncbi:hypothetical protein [Intrasporangium sp.]|uniref:hypothetical protein n=1 Tax=Intrasporangium sp. TaxID=1925024 RepID=UPI003365A6BC